MSSAAFFSSYVTWRYLSIFIAGSCILSSVFVNASASSYVSASSGATISISIRSGRLLLILSTLLSSRYLNFHGQWSVFGSRNHIGVSIPILCCNTCLSVLVIVFLRAAPVLWCLLLIFWLLVPVLFVRNCSINVIQDSCTCTLYAALFYNYYLESSDFMLNPYCANGVIFSC